MSYKNNSGPSFIVGAIVGGAIGAAVALLFAPDEGKQTRRKVASKGKKLIGKAGQKASELKEDRLDPVISDMKVEMEHKLKDAKKELERKFKDFVENKKK